MRGLLGGLVLAAAALRLPTLDVQSFWFDEAKTVLHTRGGLGDLLSDAVPDREVTPPLYYALAWGWAQLFGDGEVGLRSLSALFGIATVPLAYAAAREIASERAALTVAALVAFNPLFVWYSQEARPYALLMLLSSLVLLFLFRALREPTVRDLGAWALAAALALATHWFALFLVAPAATVLLMRTRPLRRVGLAVALPVAAGAGLLPLALDQRASGRADVLSENGLDDRLRALPQRFLLGEPGNPAGDYGALKALLLPALLLAAVALWLLVRRTDGAERSHARTAGIVAAGALLLPLAAAVIGFDYVVERNMLAAGVPLVVVMGLALGCRDGGRLGPAATAGLCAIGAAASIAAMSSPLLKRDDWRELARTLGRADAARVVLVTPDESLPALDVYLPGLEPHTATTFSARDVWVAAMRPVDPDPQPPAPGFEQAEDRSEQPFALRRYSAPDARKVDLLAVQRARIPTEAGADGPGLPLVETP